MTDKTKPVKGQAETKDLATQKTAVAPVEKNITDSVLLRVEEMTAANHLHLPNNYSAANALKSAYIILQDLKVAGEPALNKCTKNSVVKSLLKMIVLGLNPHKKQCSFIAYGNELQCNPEYAGNIAIAKRNGLNWIRARSVFKGDIFEFEILANNTIKVTKHVQTLESMGSKEVIGAYATYETEGGTVNTEVMSISQIKDAWNQGPMKGNSPAHKNFPDQMANKTVINRALKLINNSSDDSGLIMDDDEITPQDRKEAEVALTIKDNANQGETIGFTEHEEVTPQTEVKQPESKANEPEKELSEEDKKAAAQAEMDF